MSLNDLNKEVYGTNSDSLNQRMHGQTELDPFVNNNSAPSPFQNQEQWGKIEKKMSPTQKKVVWSFFSLVILILLSIGGYVFYQAYKRDAFHADRVELSINGPKEADSTQVQQYEITFKNNNRVTLKDSQILLEYAENFQPTDNLNLKYLSPTSSNFWIGDIKPGQTASVQLKGVFYAPKDFPVYIHGKMTYTPSNNSSQLDIKSQIGVNITSSPVQLDISAPDQIVDGNDVEYMVEYKNLDSRPLKDAQLRIDFPDGFEIKKQEPASSEQNSIWYLGTLESGDGGKVRIMGIMHGEKNQGKPIKVALGHLSDENQFSVFNQRDKVSKIVAPILMITQSVDRSGANNIVNAGDTITYVIRYLNTGDTSMRNAIVTAIVSGEVLDFSKLNTYGGAYDGQTGIITWKASDNPQLADIGPKAGGEIRYTIGVKDKLPVVSDRSKNYTVESLAKIDSPDIPTPTGLNKIIGSNKLQLKVATRVLFDVAGFYNDNNIKNSGPVPLLVGQGTSFTMHWGIGSVSNDIIGTKVVSSLPTGTKWLGKIYPQNEKITYNERTNQITWEVGSILAGSGIIKPRKEVAFQVGVIPQVNQIGQTMPLLNEAVLTAKDSFTSQDINVKTSAKNTNLPEDRTMGGSNYQVKAK